MVRHTLGDGIEVHTAIAEGLWNTLIDTSQFENVILNLVLNARDAMGGRGQLTLAAENVELDQRSPASIRKRVPASTSARRCPIPAAALRRH